MRHLVFGGSFDPVHRGHLAMADAACEQWQPDLLSWMPSRQAPHKLEAQAAAPMARAEMLQLVLAARGPKERLWLEEFARPGPSYTVDSLAALQAEYPEAELGFLLGGDSLSHLATWRDLPRLFQQCLFLLAPRQGWGAEAEAAFRASLAPELAASFRCRWLEMEPVGCSSSGIRQALAAGEATPDLPPAVAAYIRTHRLYRAADPQRP